MRQRAYVIFMSVCCDYPCQRFVSVGNKERIGHLHSIASATVHGVFESNPAVHHEPAVCVSEQIEIHTNLAAAAEGYEPKIFTAWA